MASAVSIKPSYSPTNIEASIVNRHGAQAQYSKNGACPLDPDIQLRKKTLFSWKTVREYCPRCEQRFQLWLSSQKLSFPPLSPVLDIQKPPAKDSSPSLPAPRPAHQPRRSPASSSLSSPLQQQICLLQDTASADEAHEIMLELRTMSRNGSTCAKIAEAGGCAAVITAMQHHMADSYLQEEACVTLANLANGSPALRMQVVEEGGIVSIVASMRRHLDSKDVQKNGCWALRNVANENAPCQKACGQFGAIPVIIAAMQHHPLTAVIQKYGIMALTNIACFMGNDAKIKRANGIAIVQRAVRTFPTDTEIQDHGSNLLSWLT